MQNDLKIICLESNAFHALVDEIVDRVSKSNNLIEDKWISKQEAKHLLRVSSDTTLQRLRDEGKIRYTQPERKMVLYDRDSILLFLEQNVREPFN